MKKVKPLTINKNDLSFFLLFCFYVCFIMGIGISIYCIFNDIHFLSTGPQSSPFFYFILGFIMLVVKIVNGKQKELKEGSAPGLLIFLIVLFIVTGVIYWKYIFIYMS